MGLIDDAEGAAEAVATGGASIWGKIGVYALIAAAVGGLIWYAWRATEKLGAANVSLHTARSAAKANAAAVVTLQADYTASMTAIADAEARHAAAARKTRAMVRVINDASSKHKKGCPGPDTPFPDYGPGNDAYLCLLHNGCGPEGASGAGVGASTISASDSGAGAAAAR